jgi:hypothetical protein
LGRYRGLAKQRGGRAVACFPGVFDVYAGDLAGGGVNLVIVVSVDFVTQNGADIFQGSEVLEGTSADDAVFIQR